MKAHLSHVLIASDAGSESPLSTNLAKNREICLVPPYLHNGTLHPIIPNAVSVSHSLPHKVSTSLKVPAATTANITKVTSTTTTASISTISNPTIVTTTSNIAVTSSFCNSSSKSYTPLVSSSVQNSSSSLSSSSSSSSSHIVRTHTPVHREQPRPIPGLSGTRPLSEDREHSTPLRPYSRGPVWSSSSVPGAQPAHSSPHISPAPVISISSLTGLHHTLGPSLHHPAPPPIPPPHHHTPPLHHGLPQHSMFAPPIVPPPPSLTSSGLQVPNPLGVDPLASPLSTNPDLLGRSPQEFNHRLLADRLSLSGSSLPSQFLASFHQHHHQHQHMHHYGPYGSGSGMLPPATPGAPQLLDKFSKLDSLYRPAVELLHRIQPALPQVHMESLHYRLEPLSARMPFDICNRLEPVFSNRIECLARRRLPPPLPGLPGPIGLPSMLQPPPGPALPGALGSNLGAFQPKSGTPSGLHPSQLLLPLQQRDGAKPQPVAPVKKTGKWCAAHVRIAWEIHIHQQSQVEAQRNSEGAKPSDLRPPSHLLPGSSLHRPELAPGPVLAPNAHSRSPFDTAHPSLAGSLFPPGPLGAAPFPRPSPYPGLSGLSSGAFGGLANIGSSFYGRDVPALPGLTSPHEWNRLHRTPPSFPTPPAWPSKSDIERDKEKEREKEAKERDRDRERERDHSISRESHHHNHHREDIHSREREGSQSRDLSHREREREHERERDHEHREKGRDLTVKRSPSRELDRRSYDDHKRESHYSVDRLNRSERSRSRSPLRNGPESLIKRESPYSRGSPIIRDLKVKEERKDDVVMIDDRGRRSAESLRPDGLHKLDGRNNMIHPPPTMSMLYPPNSVTDRRPLPPSPYDRLVQNPSLWNPFERSALDQQRMDIMRDIEREQLRRLSNPLGLLVSAPSPVSLMEANKLREQQELLLRDQAAIRERDRLMQIEKEQRERVLASFTAAHQEMERAKVPPPLRPTDAYHPAFGGPGLNSLYHPSGPSRPPSNSAYHHPPGASRPASSPVVINHNSNSSSSKSNSPSVVGAPPPLIPSTPVHNHTGSPIGNNKVRPPTPITNNMVLDNTKEKLEVNTNGLDTDTQAR
ncbi:hypothetical protein LSH36_15g06002 [Paralvinella palmiformis]|uniref:Uncharacterized protein n=1 Tax=Paralvinella palmiformis TaxID=53620 RepID=A0AAD9NHD0_9ANNE|nr:hypothetical protein LSH36_15g06002 [Paralvinella palmiformis]